MIAEQFQAAAAAARNTHAVDEVARLTWRAHAERQLDDAEAEAIGEALQARRKAFGQGRGLPAAKAAVGLPRASRLHPRSLDRQASIERRRRQAMSGIVPARIAAVFTMAECAVLTVIARQCQRSGVCTLPVDAIAALAGVCRRTVQGALCQARLVGLVLVKERRVPGRRSGTNIVTVISKDWLGWLRLGGCKTMHPTSNSAFYPARAQPSSASQEAFDSANRKNCAFELRASG